MTAIYVRMIGATRSGKLQKLWAGIESPINRLWFWLSIVRLVVRDRNRNRSDASLDRLRDLVFRKKARSTPRLIALCFIPGSELGHTFEPIDLLLTRERAFLAFRFGHVLLCSRLSSLRHEVAQGVAEGESNQ
jgi:hypothetical protein